MARIYGGRSPSLAGGQRTLFVCTTDGLDEQSFIRLVEEARPRVTLDLRSSPRFDFGSLNRRRVLSMFEKDGIQYSDLGSNIHSDEDILLTLSRQSVEPSFREAVTKELEAVNIAVFIDPRSDYRTLGLRLVKQLRDTTSLEWEVVLFGPDEESAISARRLIFFSHANPEDNEFVLWLQTQLTRHGYEVWSDLTALKGGEVFWDAIENVIRKKSARVLVVASKASMEKPSVLDEISLAVSVERTEKLNNFVIPLRMNLPFTDFRANIARKIAIDFSKSWSKGMAQLLDNLQNSRTPRTGGFGNSDLEAWWNQKKTANLRIKNEPEPLVSNQFDVDKIPTTIHLFDGVPTIDGSDSFETISQLSPLVPFQRGWLSFFSSDELWLHNISGLTKRKVISVSDLYFGHSNAVPALDSSACRRLLHRLLNRQWEWFLLQKGLIRHWAPRRPVVMYFPAGLIEKDQIEFTDHDGTSRRRKVIGFSAKRNIFWHLGLTGRFNSDISQTMQLRLSVIFTEDGKYKLISSERMAEARRSFCKNWWNDKWRGLQHAAMNWLSGNSKSIIVYSGSAGVLSLSSFGRLFTAPISIREVDLKSTEMDAEVSEFEVVSADEPSEDFDDVSGQDF